MMEGAPAVNPQIIHIHMETLSYFGFRVELVAIILASAAIFVGVAQLIAIFVGLAQMKRASRERDKQLAHQDRKLDAQNHKLEQQDRKLDFQLEALRILIERTALRPSESAGG